VHRLILTATTTLLALACCATGVAQGAGGFQDPTRNVRCGVASGAVVCTVARQTGASACRRSYVASGVLRNTGLTRLNQGCFSGRPFGPGRLKTLRRGQSTTRGGVRCTATRGGVRCVNRSRHGFVLDRTTTGAF
jgi:hypothetical protein